MYTYVLDLRFLLATYCQSIQCFSNDISSLYDFCMTFVYFYTIYKRIISEQHKWDTFADILTKGHPSSRCTISNELTENFRILQLFQWY